MEMLLNTDQDDSIIEIINFLRLKLEREWRKVEAWREDEEGNQLLILNSMERIERLTNLINHYIYN